MSPLTGLNNIFYVYCYKHTTASWLGLWVLPSAVAGLYHHVTPDGVRLFCLSHFYKHTTASRLDLLMLSLTVAGLYKYATPNGVFDDFSSFFSYQHTTASQLGSPMFPLLIIG